MSTAATPIPPPGQPPGQPQSKSAPTAHLTTSTNDQKDNETSARPREPSRMKGSRPNREATWNDPTSVPITLGLIQRILTPERLVGGDSHADSITIEDILPPLTSSNEVDLELYAILAIVIKDFVNPWYTKITTDNAFVDEIIQMVAHCSRALEERLKHVDVPGLVLDEIPVLVQAHFDAYRTAQRTTVTSPYHPSLRRVYHELCPHPALAPLATAGEPSAVPLQEANERVYRQLLLQGSLALLLPTEALQNGPLRLLLGDIIADLIVGQALAGKLTEGWFLHGAILKLAEIWTDKVQPKTTGTEIRDDAKNRLEKFGLLSSDTKFQRHHSSAHSQSRLASCFWRFMQYGYLAYLFLKYVLKEFQNVRAKPKRYHRAHVPTMPTTTSKIAPLHTPSLADRPLQPVLAFGVYHAVSTILRLDHHMPWLTSTLKFGQHVLLLDGRGLGDVNSLLDRFFYHSIETHVLSPSLLPTMLRNLRAALFPNNSMGPPAPPPPSLEERKEIKRRAAESIRSVLPEIFAHKMYGTYDDDAIINEIERDILDPLDDEYLNKHLIYAILELTLLKLMPELSLQLVSDLLAERGVIMDDKILDSSSSIPATNDLATEI